MYIVGVKISDWKNRILVLMIITWRCTSHGWLAGRIRKTTYAIKYKDKLATCKTHKERQSINGIHEEYLSAFAWNLVHAKWSFYTSRHLLIKDAILCQWQQMSQKILNHCEGIPAAVQSDSATWVSCDAVYKWPVEVPIQQPKKWAKTSCMHWLHKGDKLRICAKQNQTQTHTQKKKTTLKMMQMSFKYETEKLRLKSFFWGMWGKGEEK